MDIEAILRENPQYCLVNEFDLSNRLIQETNGDSTIVYDASSREYKILSISNMNKTNVLEAAHVHKTLVNDGIFYFLQTWSSERMRSKNITALYETRNLMKRHKSKAESEVKQSLRRIRVNMGEHIR